MMNSTIFLPNTMFDEKNSDFKDTDLRTIYLLRTLHNNEIKQSTFVLK